MSAPERSGVFAVVDPDPQLPAALAALGLASGDDHVQRFQPQGTSWIRRSGASWIALHTWPEQALVTVDTYGPLAGGVARLADLGWRPAHRPLEFTAGWAAGRRLRYRLARVHQRELGPGGEVVLGESPDLGLALFVDRRLQLCDRDAGSWHRALALPALSAHPAPRSVQVHALGTGGLAAQVLAVPGIVRVQLVVRSPQVLALARTALVDWHRGALDDPRLELGGDPAGPWDVVLSDGTDPGGASVRGYVSARDSTHAVGLEGAGRRVALAVTAPPCPGRAGLAPGLWDRLRAQAG